MGFVCSFAPDVLSVVPPPNWCNKTTITAIGMVDNPHDSSHSQLLSVELPTHEPGTQSLWGRHCYRRPPHLLVPSFNAPKILITWFTENCSGRLNDRRRYCCPNKDKAYWNHLILQLTFKSQYLSNWNTPRPKFIIIQLQYNRLNHTIC